MDFGKYKQANEDQIMISPSYIPCIISGYTATVVKRVNKKKKASTKIMTIEKNDNDNDAKINQKPI